MWEDIGKALTNVAFAGVGLVTLAAEQAGKAGKVLMERGEIAVEQGRKYSEELQQKIREDNQRRREAQLDEQISSMDAAQRQALRQRLDELDELEQEVVPAGPEVTDQDEEAQDAEPFSSEDETH